jgi:hypothetical protein
MDHLLVVLGLAAAYALLLLVSPMKACGACARHPGRPCPRCQGTGRRFRIGARLVHRGMVKARRRSRDRHGERR